MDCHIHSTTVSLFLSTHYSTSGLSFYQTLFLLHLPGRLGADNLHFKKWVPALAADPMRGTPGGIRNQERSNIGKIVLNHSVPVRMVGWPD